MGARRHSQIAAATILLLAASVCAYADAVGPVITPWYGTSQEFGRLGRPQQWVNIVGNVSDVDGVSSLTYSVNGGPAVTMGLGPDTRRLQRPGDFNADVDADLLNDGANTVTFTAFDTAGNVSNLVVNVAYSKGLVWPESYSIDWSTVANLQEAVQVVDGLWTHDATGTRTLDVGYDRILDIGDIAWDAYEITVPLTVHSIDPNGFQFPSVAPGVGITLRWRGHTDFGGNWQPIYGWLPNGSTLWYDFGAADGGEFRIAGEQGLHAADPNDHEITFGVTYNLKFRVEPITEDTARYRAKVWLDGNPEPGGWAMEGIDGPGDLPTGSLLFVAHHVDATFGDLTITALENPNPPIIINISVDTEETSATIMWSTSEPATTQIDWGLTAGLELGTFNDPNYTLPHAVTLTGLLPGTVYQYQLTGEDDANSVGSSEILSFVTRGGGAFVSDDFSAPALDPNVWTTLDPLGDSTLSMTGRQLSLSVPPGTTHDTWVSGSTAPRAMQDVPDTDFEIEAKFDSTLTQRYQGQGILIEQDADTLLRYDVYSNGSSVLIFCVVLDNGGFNIKFNQTIASDGRVRLRVNRTGDIWQMLYSTDGQNWFLAGSFTRTFVVSRLGVFASNSADAGQQPPAHTALVDYAFDTAAPIVPEDNGKVTLDVSVVGSGSVTRDPNLPIYDANTPITLTATSDQGFGFTGWSGSVVSTDNPLVISLVDDAFITATFEAIPDPDPPVISDLLISPTHNDVTVTWTTDEPSTTGYFYGQTPAYELGGDEITALVTDHSVTILNLDVNTFYEIEIFSVDPASNVGSVQTSFLTNPAPISTIVSDDFSAPVLDPNLWTFINPLADATLTNNGVHAVIAVPGGVSHSAWVDGNNAPRIMQATNDADFQVEAKYESLPSAAFQIQGIIVEQDPNTLIRINIQSNGATASVFVATIYQGAASIRAFQSISSIVPQWLRVTRVAHDWTVEYSFDGTAWTPAGAPFNFQIAVSAIGPFAGNESDQGPAPAFDGVIDYFFNTAAPIVPEDNGRFTLDVVVSGAGSVARDPNQRIYDANTPITLTATPDPQHTFTGWSGDMVSSDNPLLLSLTDDTVITATFDPVPQPPVISDLVLTPTHNSVAISWTTDKPSTTGYLYGVTPAYELGGNEDGALVTAHSITIPGLAANTLYQVEVYSVDSASNVGSVQTSFTTDPAPVSTIVSDDFSAPALDPNIWTFINPVGDCVLTATGAQAVISVPAGVAHPAWIGGIQAPRIMQAANDADFQVEAKYESLPSAAFQIQGIIVQQDPDDFIRINIQSNGTTASVFVATFHDGAPTIRVFQSISSIVPQWLRVTRANHDWTVEYSFDGAAWSSAGQFSFPIVVSSIGPFVSNEPGTGAAPAFDGVVDYFFNTAAPVAPEDGGRHSMTLNVAGNGAVTRDPNGVLYAPATEVLLTAVPVPGWSFVSWSGDLSGSDNPLNVTVNDDVIATAVFVEDDLTPPIISDFQVNAWTTSATLTFTTDEPAIGRVNYGLTAALEFGTETETAPVTAHSITLIGLDPNTTYFFEAFATDAATNESTTGVSSFATDPIIASTLVSDDFDGTALDPNVWTFIDPVGDAALVVGGSAASIDIPSGAAHDAWVTGVQSPRIVQATNDTDFEAIVKYNSAVTTQYQIQGIVVEQDPNDFIRFDVHYNGTTVVLFAATIAAGQPQIHLSRALGSSTPSYIRVTRSGNQWTLAYSFDGQSWDPQNPFSSDVSVSTVGAFVGNSPKSTGPAPAHVGVIDYFENTASPLPPRFPLTVDTIGQGTVIVDPLYATYAAGSTITLTPVPEPGWMFMRWTGDVFSKATPLVLSITEATTVRARFAPEPRSGTASVFPRP